MTVATWGMGTLIQRQDPNSLVWATVPGAKDITGPGEERDQIDITNHSSPQGREEFIGGMVRSGDVTFRMVWDPNDSVQQALKSDFDTNRTGSWRIVAPNAGNAEIAFQGFVRTLSYEFPVNDALHRAVTLKVTGAVTETP